VLNKAVLNSDKFYFPVPPWFTSITEPYHCPLVIVPTLVILELKDKLPLSFLYRSTPSSLSLLGVINLYFFVELSYTRTPIIVGNPSVPIPVPPFAALSTLVKAGVALPSEYKTPLEFFISPISLSPLPTNILLAVKTSLPVPPF
jgi:hypothetical protein